MRAIRRETRELATSTRLHAPPRASMHLSAHLREPPCASPRTSGAAVRLRAPARLHAAPPLLLHQLNVNGLRDLLDQRKVAQAGAHRNVSAGSHRARQSLLDSGRVVKPNRHEACQR